MTANPPLPKLPGYTVSLPQSLGDKAFFKAQTLNYLNGYQREEPNPIVKELPEAVQTLAATAPLTGASTLTFSVDSPTKLPQWVENDRKVLRFYGYFKETVNESNMENYRVRKVILYYYLEDDSMHIAEPRQDNSGIPQGIFVKRHKATKDEGGFFSPLDFSVGEELTIYARTYYLVDADSFTREYYIARHGKEQGPPMPYPDDPVDAYRTTFGMNRGLKTGVASPGSTTQRLDDFKSYMEARLGKASHMLGDDKLRQWLENNKKVLRFYCVWDDRQGMYGDRRPYVLHYFLEDDSVEILEIRDSNNGRDPYPVFLKRAPLPKSVSRIGPNTVGIKPRAQNCYRPDDLRLGQYVSVFNRDFLLHDCDGFTKAWYMENLGFMPEELQQVEIKEPITPLSKPALAPFNGYGTLEDSLQNCLSLLPKPPRRDMHKLMNKDKIILRFTVRIVETDTHKHSSIDLGRRFVLSYFMMDDTIMVFEPPLRNSGLSGGKFLERARVYKPQSEEIYTYLDLYVGGSIQIFNRKFEMVEADEYTYTYMENNKHIFIMSDHEILLKSLRAQISGREEAIRTELIRVDKEGSGSVSGEALESALEAAGLKFTRHQAICLRRRLDREKTGSVSIEEFLNVLGISK
ncbi:hypothetical protein CEUSTIGMA_g13160.t1 [Chlamydomonas eustigma]|uniref:DM10 domain-containing protein n=1 Tax=Chlamydomonas eustigma TaxID=1157962 RepID=A0A250XRR2_9CHLO|nr:hypothetical protein CEUSTIGMA_g13160.t1 [Chlamydomonas eustigma]|eukprot:GAX85745.1 hypothetical protein CEUSTIGMA_g13160.t1 [Chlamydomonas eustigma]